MKEVDQVDLQFVIGGARGVAASSRRVNADIELALTKLASDLREAQRPQVTQAQTMTMMMAAMIASRRFA